MKKIVNLWLLSCILTLVACGQKAEKQQEVKEDTAAKKMLQGIWLNDDDEDDVAFRVKGDTIYYPDSTSQPVYFYIAGDTLVMKGANIAKYPIVKQAEHIFQFKVQNGDVVNPYNEGGFHNYGMAVDLSILGSDGVALDMGSPYDFFGEEAHTVDDDYLLKTGRISEAAYHNRRFLYAVMREQELYPLPNEWWHYQHYVQESDKKRFKILDF